MIHTKCADFSIRVYRSFQSEWQHKTNIEQKKHHSIQCIATISLVQRITILAHVQIITMQSLYIGGHCAMRVFHLACWHYA